MPTTPDEASVREQAYYFWEQDGRPDGRETEYWRRATVAVTERAQMNAPVAPGPKKAARPKAEPTPVPKLKAAASKTKAVPAKAEKPKKK